MMRQGSTRSAAQSLTQEKGVGQSAGRRWEEQDCCIRQAAAQLAFEDAQHLRARCDASKLGSPAEETVLYFLWAGKEDLADVGAPQARL
eukprot:13309856-Alexandrium_andersonii.AAC.1